MKKTDSWIENSPLAKIVPLSKFQAFNELGPTIISANAGKISKDFYDANVAPIINLAELVRESRRDHFRTLPPNPDKKMINQTADLRLGACDFFANRAGEGLIASHEIVRYLLLISLANRVPPDIQQAANIDNWSSTLGVGSKNPNRINVDMGKGERKSYLAIYPYDVNKAQAEIDTIDAFLIGARSMKQKHRNTIGSVFYPEFTPSRPYLLGNPIPAPGTIERELFHRLLVDCESYNGDPRL